MTNVMHGKFSGTRDGREYQYDATWHQMSDGLIWSARVHSSWGFHMFPGGTVRGSNASSDDARVRAAVEGAVERRVNLF